MTHSERKQTEDGDPRRSRRLKDRPTRRVPTRYDILIQCRDEAEQRELFERLQALGLKLRLLVL